MECESIKLHNYTEMIILYYIIILSKVSVRVCLQNISKISKIYMEILL